MQSLRLTLIALTAVLGLVSPPRAQEPARAAFFGFHLIDTSLNATHDAEDARIEMLNTRLVAALAASGRYSFVDTAPVAQQAARYDNLAQCNGCDTDLASSLGASLAVTGEVQKTSNLILSISVYIRDARSGALVGGGSADIRGNTDESWRRGIDFIIRRRLLAP